MKGYKLNLTSGFMRNKILNWLKANHMPFNDGVNEVFIVQKDRFTFIYNIDYNDMSLTEFVDGEENDYLSVDQDDAYELVIEIFGI